MKWRCGLTDQILSSHFHHARPEPDLQPASKDFSPHPPRPAKVPCGQLAPPHELRDPRGGAAHADL